MANKLQNLIPSILIGCDLTLGLLVLILIQSRGKPHPKDCPCRACKYP